jgi:hypothetical protein
MAITGLILKMSFAASAGVASRYWSFDCPPVTPWTPSNLHRWGPLCSRGNWTEPVDIGCIGLHNLSDIASAHSSTSASYFDLGIPKLASIANHGYLLGRLLLIGCSMSYFNTPSRKIAQCIRFPLPKLCKFNDVCVLLRLMADACGVAISTKP